MTSGRFRAGPAGRGVPHRTPAARPGSACVASVRRCGRLLAVAQTSVETQTVVPDRRAVQKHLIKGRDSTLMYGKALPTTSTLNYYSN
jgi:hypothetical protein